jgi:hypothetical protein
MTLMPREHLLPSQMEQLDQELGLDAMLQVRPSTRDLWHHWFGETVMA